MESCRLKKTIAKDLFLSWEKCIFVQFLFFSTFLLWSKEVCRVLLFYNLKTFRSVAIRHKVTLCAYFVVFWIGTPPKKSIFWGPPPILKNPWKIQNGGGGSKWGPPPHFRTFSNLKNPCFQELGGGNPIAIFHGFLQIGKEHKSHIFINFGEV